MKVLEEYKRVRYRESEVKINRLTSTYLQKYTLHICGTIFACFCTCKKTGQIIVFTSVQYLPWKLCESLSKFVELKKNLCLSQNTFKNTLTHTHPHTNQHSSLCYNLRKKWILDYRSINSIKLAKKVNIFL